MSVSLSSHKLFDAGIFPAVFMALALTLTGCGGGGASDSSVQATDVVSDSNEETTGGGTEIPVEVPEQQPTYTLNLISQPSDVVISQGQSANLSVTVEHDQPITVTWNRAGTVIQSSSNTSVSVASGGVYGCSVSDGNSVVECDDFYVTVESAQFVSINQQPSNQMVNEGVDVTLSVGATGSNGLAYQWYFEGGAISGATGASLVLESVSLADGGDYYVVVTSGGTSETSGTASVSVAANPVGRAVISWDVPSDREDQSGLDPNDIVSYEIHHSDSAVGGMLLLDTVSASNVSYTATSLTSGVHYFSLKTVDVNGLKSTLSSPVSVSIN